MPRSLLPHLVAAVVLATAVLAQETRPPVPPGRDPGGLAVAVVGGGLDYTLPRLAQRLARDGEGELIGWDLEHNDRRPHGKAGSGADMGVASLLLEMDGVRLVPVRLKTADPTSAARAVAFSAHTPARVVLLPLTTAPPGAWESVLQAATRFKAVLLILPADAAAAVPAFLGLDNVVAIEPVVEAADVSTLDGTSQRLAGPLLAVAAAGRAAAGLLVREPRLDAGALKRRLIEAGGSGHWRVRS